LKSGQTEWAPKMKDAAKIRAKHCLHSAASV
jgi:hypothetical protein